MKKKNKKIAISAVIILLFLVSCILLFINYSKDDKSLSIVEKKWITNNTNKVINVNVFNDIPVYGFEGNGIIFDYLDKLANEYNINFNKNSYYSKDKVEYSDIAFKVLNPFDKMGNNDILLYEDNYVILSKDNSFINDITDISNESVDVVESDYELISSYFSNKDKITKYASDTLLLDAIKGDSVKYIIVPNMMYMDKILSNKLNIIYHFTDLDKKYILSTKDSTLFGILTKYYYKFLENDYTISYSKNYLDLYFSSAKVSSLDQKNYNARIYKYGYIVNMPYENYVNNEFVGVISNYLRDFEDITNAEIKTIKYNSIDDIKNALVSGDIDFALANFDYDKINMEKYTTNSFLIENYVVLSKDNINVNSVRGLKNYNVSVIGSSNLYDLCVNSGINPKIYNDSDSLLRNLDDDSVVLVDKNTYLYYKDGKLKNYKIVLEDSIDSGYKFLINKEYSAFASLFNYYVSSISYNDIRYKYNTNVSLNGINTNIVFIIFIILFILCLVYLAFRINKSRELINNVNKDDKSKFIDTMTSLKNRNYLNHNIYTWDDNVIFPQSIIVFDINKLREINDKLGREAGDEIIKKIASILIDNQIEHTDIIRSGGDEFLIYMVGYEEKDTVEYAKKLLKLMKDVDHLLGVSFGYSMIYDEVKTIDDAINESVNMMMSNKNKE